MKTFNKNFPFAALALVASLPAFGQTTFPSTTLSAAITSKSALCFSVTSATNFTVGYLALIDHEGIDVTSISGTRVCGVRGKTGTATLHANAATIYVGPPRYFTAFERIGPCVSTNEEVLPVINLQDGLQYLCDAGSSTWRRYQPQAAAGLLVTGITPKAAASATAADDTVTITGGTGGAQSATTSNGAAGGRVVVTGGVGGAGGTSSGTGGSGGALLYTGGAGGGTITGGTGGAVTFTGGAGGAGSTAGGTGGALTLGSGAAGSGGTGTVGAVAIKSGATSVFTASTAGAVAVIASGTAQSVSLTPSTSGTVKVTGGTDPTKIVSIDASGNTTAVTQTLAFGATTARTATFPDASITVSGATATDCGTAAGACSTSTISSTVKIVTGTAAASSGTPSTVAITGMPAFTSTTSYKCFASNATTAANVFSPLTAGYVSTTAVTFTGPNTLTDTIRWMCIGF